MQPCWPFLISVSSREHVTLIGKSSETAQCWRRVLQWKIRLALVRGPIGSNQMNLRKPPGVRWYQLRDNCPHERSKSLLKFTETSPVWNINCINWYSGCAVSRLNHDKTHLYEQIIVLFWLFIFEQSLFFVTVWVLVKNLSNRA